MKSIRLIGVLFTLYFFSYCGTDQTLTKPTRPDESRFTPVVLAQGLDEPIVFEPMKNGDVVIIERKGDVKMYVGEWDSTITIAHIPVNTKYTSAAGVVREAEEGLMGFSLDPDYETNHWAYIYYAHPTEKKHILTRWILQDRKLLPSSEKVLLEVHTQREVCCHTGGGMAWDEDKNLYLTIGNNTGSNIGGQTDEREGRSSWDDQGHAWNTNDLRGKIIRIHPEDDGTYTIPDGNLFPKGTDKTRPEIYAMGLRNPWRIFVDSKTGFVYWGEVGPDANEDTRIGPRGYDELNQARGPGNFGWPFFVGPNAPFPYYDYKLDSILDYKDSLKPTNFSINNTGLQQLPPIARPFIYYPYANSEEFPIVGSGSRCAVGGPIFRRADFASDAKRLFPDYYEGKWLAVDFSRGWIMAISMKENGDYDSMEQFLPSYHPIQPIDMKFGPEGDLYVLEYGSTYFAKSATSQLVRIEYNAGNRKPLVEAHADKLGGKPPFDVQLSSDGSVDLDGDQLSYLWRVTDKEGTLVKELHEKNPLYNFDKQGEYTVTLTVSDPYNASNSKSVEIVSGNTPPEISFDVAGNNTFYFPGEALKYAVTVSDAEDGIIKKGSDLAGNVAVSIEYVSDGFDVAEAVQSQRGLETSANVTIAQTLLKVNNCVNCHNPEVKTIGPGLKQISEKYKSESSEIDRLIRKIQTGGSGVWGEAAMPANPSVTDNDAHTILKYIMELTGKKDAGLPLEGSFMQNVQKDDAGTGSLILQASYSDQPQGNIPSQKAYLLKKLINPKVSVKSADRKEGVDAIIDGRLGTSGEALVKPRHNGFISFSKIDLTGIKSLKLEVAATIRENNSGGTIEVRENNPNGKLFGTVPIEVSEDTSGVFNRSVLRGKRDVFVDLGSDSIGVVDLYLVFKNAKAGPNQPLLTLKDIEFRKETIEKPEKAKPAKK